MKVSKCCKANLEFIHKYPSILDKDAQEDACHYIASGWACAKCHKPCRVIDLPDKEKEESNNG